MSGSPAYGFVDDDGTRRLLRPRPPRAVLAWVEAQLGASVVSTRTLKGGQSSAVHEVTLRSTADGDPLRVVLRRYVRDDPEEPDMPARECRTLLYLGDVGLTGPRLLAEDVTGRETGVPTLLMSRVPGRVEWSPKNTDRWLHRLVEQLPPIHAAPLPTAGVIRTYAPYAQDAYRPPSWARWPAVWDKAIEIFHGPTPEGPKAFIHRDYHPGNVLWRRGVVTSVVDWQCASIGPPSVDVAHCRGNLLGYGDEVVDRFTTIWEDMSGATFDPWADIVTHIGWLDGLCRADRPLYSAEDALARAVAGRH